MYVTVDNKQVNYEVEGEGKAVILLPGWLCDHNALAPIANHLKSKFKVYSIDVVGFGKSELPDKPYDTNKYGDWLKELIEKLEIENPILIGHSHGGRMAINYAGRNLGTVNKMILIDAAGIKPKRKLGYFIRVYTYKFLKNIYKILPKNKMFENMKTRSMKRFGSSDYQNSPDVLKKTMSNILNEDQKEIMPNIKTPTLLIWGDKDTATPIQDGKAMEKLIPGSGLVEVKGGGHYSFLDNPTLVCAVLDEFLKQDC